MRLSLLHGVIRIETTGVQVFLPAIVDIMACALYLIGQDCRYCPLCGEPKRLFLRNLADKEVVEQMPPILSSRILV